MSLCEHMHSMLPYDTSLTHLQASPLEVSPANQDISKANNGKTGGTGDSAGGQVMKDRKIGAKSGGSRVLKQCGVKYHDGSGDGGS